MEKSIEKAIKAINDKLSQYDGDFKAVDILQLSQAALNLAHVQSVLNETEKMRIQKSG